jgi:hypothetical protein
MLASPKAGVRIRGQFSTNHTFHTNDTNEIDGQKFENRNAKFEANPNPKFTESKFRHGGRR